MRPVTAIILLVLMVAIIGAAFYQLVLAPR